MQKYIFKIVYIRAQYKYILNFIFWAEKQIFANIEWDKYWLQIYIAFYIFDKKIDIYN